MTGFKKRLFRQWAVILALTVLFGGVSVWQNRSPQNANGALGTPLLIVMYHGVLDDQSGRLGEYVISESELKSDFDYLRENGYTCVTISRVISCVENGTPLPDKAVMLTFDDGYFNNYQYAYPLLKAYGFTAVLSPICKWTELYSESGEQDSRYTHVIWEHLREMLDSGCVELANHTYNLHTVNRGRQGCARKTNESVNAYRQLLAADLEQAQTAFEQHLSVKPVAFTYPFGAVSAEAQTVLRELGFRLAFTCEEKVNYLTDDETALFHLGRFKRPHGVSGEAFFQKITV